MGACVSVSPNEAPHCDDAQYNFKANEKKKKTADTFFANQQISRRGTTLLLQCNPTKIMIACLPDRIASSASKVNAH